jgi:DNA polymerase epsilon subunit 1
MELAGRDDILPIVGAPGLDEPVLAFKQDMVSKQFAKDLTRAVAEIRREGPDENLLPEMMAARHSLHLHDPAVDFIKNIIVIMELDEDIEPQVHTLKQSLLAQVGVAEYAEAAQWKNPCPKYMLPDLFCTECQESRDVNLCYIPPFEGQEEEQQHDHRAAASWSCVHCGSPYSVAEIERRLLWAVQKKMVRYVLQDVRNPASSYRVATRALATDCVHGVTLEVNPDQARNDLELLLHLAEYHELDALRTAVAGILGDYQED